VDGSGHGDAVGIALVVIATIEIGWIVRTVQANLPRA
jgi:hypothetical protein